MNSKGSITITKYCYIVFFKRFFDILLSLSALIIFSPVFVVVALLVRKRLGNPIFFKHARPGRNEETFIMYKFRTMTEETDKNGILLPSQQRLSKFGRMLRSTSLDELPELFNILKGDMSLVGPRPLSVKYLPYYTHFEKRRHDVRPGLTGLAQINGRNMLNWEKRFELDIEYIDNISFILDIKIIFKTIVQVMRRADIGYAGVDCPESFIKYREKKQV